MNEMILNIIKKKYDINNIILVYYCGSIGYGLNNEESDIDVTIILKSGENYSKESIDNIDFFVYNFYYFKKVQRLENDADMYLKTSADVILNFEKNIIFMNDAFTFELKQLYGFLDFQKFLSPFLSNFIEYYDNLLYIRCPQYPKRRMYHIFRVLGILETFSKTGIYDINNIDADNFDNMKLYKIECKTNPSKARKDVELAFNKLKNVVFNERFVTKKIYVGEVIGLKNNKLFYFKDRSK